MRGDLYQIQILFIPGGSIVGVDHSLESNIRFYNGIPWNPDRSRAILAAGSPGLRVDRGLRQPGGPGSSHPFPYAQRHPGRKPAGADLPSVRLRRRAPYPASIQKRYAHFGGDCFPSGGAHRQSDCYRQHLCRLRLGARALRRA